MSSSQDRPRRESGRKVTFIERREDPITQITLARIQQLKSDIEEDSTRVWARNELKREWAKVRRRLLCGSPVERGPIRAFIRKTGGRKTLIVK
jgi:hypothetical protein